MGPGNGAGGGDGEPATAHPEMGAPANSSLCGCRAKGVKARHSQHGTAIKVVFTQRRKPGRVVAEPARRHQHRTTPPVPAG
ncbi:hypothetical protein MJ575_00650 [Klebsiella pneumoniae]|nr:hypothetical protein MJ575_00650 [Klebsiella pneumoniae]